MCITLSRTLHTDAKTWENDEIECIWLELKPHAFGLSLFVCYLYTNPAVTVEWYDSFVQMLDDVYKVKNCADVLILGHFSIDTLKLTLILGFYPCSLWTCSSHYFTHTNNAQFDVINRSHLYEQP